MNKTSVLHSNPNKKYWPWLLLLLSVFIVSKLFTLYTPLFHDEIGVYGRLLFYMFEHGPSMHPADVTPEFGRGHPLFFTYVVSLISSWVGSNYIAARTVILGISVGTILMTYSLAKHWLQPAIALSATLLLVIQPIFYAQSTMLLPEIMLCLLAMLSLDAYLRKSFGGYLFWASLLVLTKETGMVLMGAVALNEWKKVHFSWRPLTLLSLFKWLLPLLSLVGFFVVQKQAYGWYMYPFHTSLISFNPATIGIRLLLNLSNLLLDQGRFALTIGCIYACWKMDKTAIKAFFDRYFLWLAFIGLMLIFSSLNYVMTRYLLLILPATIIVIVGLLTPFFGQGKYLLIACLMSLPFQFSFLFFRQDNDMGYLIVVENMKESIAKLDELTAGKPAMIWAQFPELNALDFIHDGYVTNPNYVLRTVYKDSIDYILISDRDYLQTDKLVNNMEYVIENKVDSILNDSIAFKNSGFELVYEKVLFYNRQRIFKTNNYLKRPADYTLKVED